MEASYCASPSHTARMSGLVGSQVAAAVCEVLTTADGAVRHDNANTASTPNDKSWNTAYCDSWHYSVLVLVTLGFRYIGFIAWLGLHYPAPFVHSIIRLFHHLSTILQFNHSSSVLC
jgi:hypothetical protein